MTSYRCSLFGMLLIASTGAVAPFTAQAAESAVPVVNDQASYTVAQWFEPRERRQAYRSYFDEYGRKITVDRRGRIVSVEEAQTNQSNEGTDYFPDAPQDPYDTGAISNDPYGTALPSESDYGSVNREPLPPANGESDLQPTDPNLVEPGAPSDGLTDVPQQEQIPVHPNPAPTIELPKGTGRESQDRRDPGSARPDRRIPWRYRWPQGR